MGARLLSFSIIDGLKNASGQKTSQQRLVDRKLMTWTARQENVLCHTEVRINTGDNEGHCVHRLFSWMMKVLMDLLCQCWLRVGADIIILSSFYYTMNLNKTTHDAMLLFYLLFSFFFTFTQANNICLLFSFDPDTVPASVWVDLWMMNCPHSSPQISLLCSFAYILYSTIFIANISR